MAFAIATALWAVLAVFAVTSARFSRPTRNTVVAASFFSLALLIRLATANFGPGDYKLPQGDALASSNGAPSPYGPGSRALLELIFAVFPRSDTTIVWVSLVAGSLCSPLLWSLCRRLRLDAVSSGAAAMFFAVAPLAVRLSGEGNRQMQGLFLALLGWHALVGLRQRFEWTRGLLWLCSVVLAFQVRPELVALVPLGILGTLFLGSELRRWPVWLGHALLSVLMLGGWLHSSGLVAGQIATFAAATLEGARGLGLPIWLHPAFTSPIFAGLSLLGGVALFTRDRMLATWLLSALALLALLSAEASPSMTSARYQTLALPFSSILAGYPLGVVARRLPGPGSRIPVTLILGGAAVLASLPTLLRVTTPTTADLEYHFIRSHLSLLPRRAHILHTYPYLELELGLQPPGYLSDMLGTEQYWHFLDDGEVHADLSPGPGYFYWGSYCSAENRGSVGESCRDALDAFEGSPLFVEEIPARPIGYERFDTPTVRIGLYALPGWSSSVEGTSR